MWNKTSLLRSEQRALQKVFAGAAYAFWKGIIAAARTTPLASFGLTFLSELQDACKTISDDQRTEIALALRRARFEDIAGELEVFGLEQAETRAMLAQVLKAIGEMTEFQSGKIPALESILDTILHANVVSRENKEQIVQTVRTEMGARLIPIACKLDSVLSLLREFPGTIRHVIESARDDDQAELERYYLKAIEKEYGTLKLLGIRALEQIWRSMRPSFLYPLAELEMKHGIANPPRKCWFDNPILSF